MDQTVPEAAVSPGLVRRLSTIVRPVTLDVAILAAGAATFVWYLGGLVFGRPYVDFSVPVVLLGLVVIALGARRLAGGRPAGRGRYNPLPYLIVVATGVLPVAAIMENRSDKLVLTVAALLVTALVILRQMVALRENDRLLAELGDQERRFRLLVQNSTDVVTITEPDGTVRYVNPAVRRLLGAEPDALVGNNISHRFHPDDRPILADRVGFVARNPGATATYRVRVGHADGSWRWIEIVSANLRHEPGVGGIVSSSRDITGTHEVPEPAGHDGGRDALTGLANREVFGERVRAGLAGADPGRRLSIALIDLDDFTSVNDTFGRHVGDGLLVTAAQRMRSNVRHTDTVARLGRDEFAILLDGLNSEDVDGVLGRIAEALLEPVVIEGHLLSVQASFGVVDGRAGDDAADLLRRADVAVNDAKERGEGGLERYRPAMNRGTALLRQAAELRAALAGDQLVVHYQPVVTLPCGRITGVEALVRWQHPERGLLGPGAFVEAAERTGLIVALGRWVLREATRQAAAWMRAYGVHAPGSVSVNVSAWQLRDAAFASEVAAALRDSGLPAHRLTIEITESTAVGGGATRGTLRALRGLGVRLSLDDFGTGASTLSLLATCPVDQIKLDRSFTPVPGPDAIATAVLQLANAFGLEAVAEGVETPAQAEKLERLGYVRAQGYLFARPMSPGQLEDELGWRAERVAQPAG